jgi:ATPase subunit of ABC transporter with duplicated ATPase domains
MAVDGIICSYLYNLVNLTFNNITMQFGAKPLFENVSVKFGDGNRYGLIGANGAGKSTFMKILAGVLEPTAGNVALDSGERMAFLRQDQFAYEDLRVLDVVMMGHAEMWKCMQEKDAIYANPEATEEDYMRAAELEGEFAEYDGYTAEARAGELLLGVGIPTEQHTGPMREVAPGWKLRVLLCQALFANPDILLLDEPTNNLDINTIRWLEHVLNERNSTMIIISHDRHFLNQVCTHMADLDYGRIQVYPGTWDDYIEASTQARERQSSANAEGEGTVADLQEFVRRFSANKSKAKQATSRAKQIEKIKIEEFKPSSRQYPWIRFDYDEKEKAAPSGGRDREPGVRLRSGPADHQGLHRHLRRRRPHRHHRRERRRQDHLLKLLVGELHGLTPQFGTIKWAEKAKLGYFAQDHSADFASDENLTDWISGYVREGGYEGDDADHPDPRHAGPAAVRRRRREEVGQGDVRRRAGPHDVRPADAAAQERAAARRADQPHGHGIDRIPQLRPR